MDIDQIRNSTDYWTFKNFTSPERAKRLAAVKYGIIAALVIAFVISVSMITIGILAGTSDSMILSGAGFLLVAYAIFVVYNFSNKQLAMFIGLLKCKDFTSMALITGEAIQADRLDMSKNIMNIMTFALVEEDERLEKIESEMQAGAAHMGAREFGPAIGKIQGYTIHEYVILTDSSSQRQVKLMYHGYNDTNPVAEFNKLVARNHNGVQKLGFVVQRTGEAGGLIYMEE
jgi:hypothetical protein